MRAHKKHDETQGEGHVFRMAKKQSTKAMDPPIPSGSKAAKMASLTAEMLKVGIFKMKEGSDPHWLAQYFFMRCENAWENYKKEHNPVWTVTATEIVEVAISLMRFSIRPKNGFEHCNQLKDPLPEAAIQWIADAHHTLCEIEKEKSERLMEVSGLDGIGSKRTRKLIK